MQCKQAEATSLVELTLFMSLSAVRIIVFERIKGNKQQQTKPKKGFTLAAE